MASRETGADGGEPIAGANDPGTVTRRSAVGSSTRPVIAPTPPLASPEGVGYVPGSGAVQLDGSFRYSIPIDVPPGRAGMEPGLSLEYSSRGGNGPLGVGWSLGGTSAIRRCDKIVASGGVRAGIGIGSKDAFGSKDAYCLDGQRLFQVAGTAGKVGAEYRTEVESFTRVKITAVGGSWGGGEDGTAPSAWTAEFKDGRVASYQSIPWDVAQDVAGIPYGLRTLVDTNGAVTATLKRNDLVWPLVKVTDRSGNSIVWEDMGTDVNGPGYVRSTTALGVGSEPLPSRILYTKCDLQPCTYASDTRRVEFGYKDRSASDPIRNFVSGIEVVTTRQLETITTSVKDGSTWVKQREYRLGYAPSATSRRTLLRSVTVCDGAGICATPTTFSWQDTASGGYVTRTSSPDFAYTTTLNGGIGTMEIAALDANGDGNDDVTLLDFAPDNATWKKRVILADGGGYYKSAVDVAWPWERCKFGHPGASIPVDLDANGRTELVYECSEEGYRVLGWDDAQGTLVEQDVPGLNGKPMPGWPAPGGVVVEAAEGMLKFPDLDGDGLPDMVWGATSPADATWTAQKGIPTSLTPATLPQISYGTAYNTHIRSIGPPQSTLVSAERLIGQVTTVLDQNGDGHAELTQMDYRYNMRGYSQESAPPLATYIYRDELRNMSWAISLGLANTLQTNWGEPIYDSGNKRGLWYFADVNGDGLKDALYREEVGVFSSPVWFLRMNTGSGYTSPTTNLGPGSVALTDYATDLIKHPDAGVIGKGSDNGLRIADMNGDGRDDLVLFEPAGTPGSHWSLHAKTTGRIRILHSNGRGWDAPVTLPAYPAGYVRLFYGKGNPNPRWPMTTLADVDGNGLPDVVEMVGDTTTKLRTLVTQALGGLPGGVDLLKGVEGIERGNQQIYYDAMSSGSGNRSLGSGSADTHVPARSATYPQSIATKGHVVRQFSTRVGGAGEVNETYQYEGGLLDVTGRGLLGFDKVTKTDRVTGVKTTYRFDLRPVFADQDQRYRHYPRAGRPISTETTPPATGFGQHAPDLQDATGPVATPRSTWEVDFVGHPLQVLKQRTTSFVEGSSSSSNVETVIDYDVWQNPYSVKTTTTDATVNPPRVYTRQVSTSFSNTASTWLLGQATSVRETTDSSGVDPWQEDPASPSANTVNWRNTSFEYDSRGRLAFVYREPSSGLSVHRVQRIYRGGGGVVIRVRDYAPTGVSCGADADCQSNACFATKVDGARQCYVDAANDVTIYDASGSVAEGFRNGLGQTQWVLYDPAHMWPYATMDLNGVKTEIKRDGFGRVLETRSDTGAKTTYAYEQNIVRETELNGRSRTTFRTFGRPVLTTWSTFNGGTGIAKVSYNSLGKPVRTTYNTSTLTQGAVSASRSDAEAALEGGLTIGRADYDAAGRPTSTVNGTTEKTSYTYLSPLGKTRVTDASGLETTTTVDLLGRPLQVDQKSAAGQTYNTNYRYRGDGSLTSIRNPDGIVDRFYYDRLGRRTSWRTGGFSGTLANSVVRWAATYDSLDNPVTVERDGVVSTYTYDALGRETSRTSGTEHQTYAWDATNGVGQRKSISTDTGGGHETLFTYNTLGQLEERRENYAGGTTSLSYGYTYDAVGRLDKMRYPEVSPRDVSAASHTHRGMTVRYTYQNGQLKQIKEVLAASEPVLWEATRRHVMGMAEEAKYGSAISNVWGYDPNTLRPSTQAPTGNSGPTINQSFVYYENGTLKQKTASDIVENFEYDGSRRFLRKYSRRSTGNDNFIVDATFSHGVQGVTGVDTTAATATDWRIDDETYTFPTATPYKYLLGSHKVGTAAAWSFVYDAAGRVQDIKEGTTVRRHYDWNSFNLPTTVSHFDTNVTRTFGYDGVGARVRKTQDAINEVLYVGDLYEARNLTALGTWESVYRLRADVGIVAELVHPWGQTTRTTRYLFTDQQGSPAFEVTGTTPTKRGFFPYGKRMGTPPTQNFSQLGYTGHRQDDDLGLIDMKGRVYDIRTRRFLTRDPLPDQIFTSFGTHPYSYVGNNPTNLVDPNGFQSGTSYPGNLNQSAQTLSHVADAIKDEQEKNKPADVTYDTPDIIIVKPPGPDPGDKAPDAGEPGDAGPGDSGGPGDRGPAVGVGDGGDRGDAGERDGGRIPRLSRNNAGDAGRSEVFGPPVAPPPIMPPMVGEARGLADPNGYGPVDTFVGDSPGLTGYTDPARRYAHVDVADVLWWAGDMWAAEHPDAPRLQFGDISKEGGGDIGHKSHRNGVDVDIRVMSTAGEIYDNGPGKNGEGASPTYSQELTRDAIQTVLNAASDFGVEVTDVFFDDSAMTTDLVRPDKHSNHHDHFHVRFRIP